MAMNNRKEELKKNIKAYHNDTVAFRRHIHKNPELSTKEHKTAGYVESQLDKFGISHERMAGTGVIGLIEGQQKGKTIALRADMDALPLKEENSHEYISDNEGIMHACGHDAHTAILLGAARVLNERKEHIRGKVLLIFQPSEENFPGGARMLLDEGLFKKYQPDKIIGLHVDPDIDSGKVGMKAGQYMASTDEVYLTVKGKGGHAAMPEKNVDTVVLASQILTSLQQIASRNAPPDIPTVLSFGRFIADGRTNIIPDEVFLSGTFRTFDEEWRTKAHQRIKTIAENTALAMGGQCDITIDKGYPFLVNNEQLTQMVFQQAQEYLGENNVETLPVRMTAEDFAYYSQEIPACFYRLGIRNESMGITSNLHSPTFDIDEKSLETGVGLMSWLALQNR